MTLIKSIELNPVSIQSSWNDLKKSILETPPGDLLSDMSRLKVFVANFFEYFKEYEVLKNCTEEEYLAVLYYIVISNEGHGQAVQGEELKMIIRILSRLRDNSH